MAVRRPSLERSTTEGPAGARLRAGVGASTYVCPVWRIGFEAASPPSSSRSRRLSSAASSSSDISEGMIAGSASPTSVVCCGRPKPRASCEEGAFPRLRREEVALKIGKPERFVTVEPLEDPVPREVQAEPPRRKTHESARWYRRRRPLGEAGISFQSAPYYKSNELPPGRAVRNEIDCRQLASSSGER